MLKTDKYYWHRYVDLYQTLFEKAKATRKIETVVEWGVLKGESIAWLHSVFPDAEIHGLDIVAEMPNWPKHDRIIYHQVNQNEPAAIQAFYSSITPPDFIIEDGSHFPRHQSDCLRIGFKSLRVGGTYILEDIHTAYCAIIDKSRLLRHRVLNRLKLRFPSRLNLNSLSLLLALEHYRDLKLSDHRFLEGLARDSDFSVDDVVYLSDNIGTYSLFRRNKLPLKCWRCGGSNYEFRTLRCECGADVFGISDSMSYILTKK